MGLLDRLKGRATTTPMSPGATGVPYQFAFVDVETTGLDARVHRVIEIAIVITDARGTSIDEWCSLVRPRPSLGRCEQGPHDPDGVAAGGTHLP